jgi:hypothetical protein
MYAEKLENEFMTMNQAIDIAGIDDVFRRWYAGEFIDDEEMVYADKLIDLCIEAAEAWDGNDLEDIIGAISYVTRIGLHVRNCKLKNILSEFYDALEKNSNWSGLTYGLARENNHSLIAMYSKGVGVYHWEYQYYHLFKVDVPPQKRQR